MSFAAILSAAGMASDILGGLKGNKQKAMPGQQLRPMEDSLSDIDKLRAYLEQNTQYNARPTRRLTAPELEGDFAPVAVREIQNFYDQNFQREQQGQAQAAPMEKQASATGKTIAQYVPAPQKGGGEGFYILSDGTKVSESEMSTYQAKQTPGWRGDIDQQRILGQNYGQAQQGGGMPQQGGLTPQELQMLRTMMMGAQGGNR